MGGVTMMYETRVIIWDGITEETSTLEVDLDDKGSSLDLLSKIADHEKELWKHNKKLRAIDLLMENETPYEFFPGGFNLWRVLDRVNSGSATVIEAEATPESGFRETWEHPFYVITIVWYKILSPTSGGIA
jgi:hypothetical protein